MARALLTRPAALLPLGMSVAAFAIAVGYAALFGTAPQPDEGTAAHLWQLLMAGQLPFMGFCAVRWLPAQPRQALVVLTLQVSAAIVALAPVWWFGW
jgi:hypothetical protein